MRGGREDRDKGGGGGAWSRGRGLSMERRSVGWRSESANASTFHRFDTGRPVVIHSVDTSFQVAEHLLLLCPTSLL